MRSSIQTRLRVGLVAVGVALALLSAAAVFALNRLGGAIETILRENYASVVACEDMKEALERLDSAAQFASSGREDIGVPMLLQHRPIFGAAFAREAANVTLPGEQELVSDIEARAAAYNALVDRALALPAPERSARYFRDLLPGFTLLKDRIPGRPPAQPRRDGRRGSRREGRGRAIGPHRPRRQRWGRALHGVVRLLAPRARSFALFRP